MSAKRKVSHNARLIIEAAYESGSINESTYRKICQKYDME